MKFKRSTFALPAVLALACLGFGNPGVPLVEEGNRLYAEGDWEGALAKYNEALLELPQAREILYNIGGVRYRQGDLEAAADLYKSILEDPDPALAARAAYNFGNTLFQNEKYPQAAEAYKAAMKLEPGDEDARFNYELARLKMQEQQQEEQEKEQQEQQKEEEEEEEEQEEQPAQPTPPEEQEEKEQPQGTEPSPSPRPSPGGEQRQPRPPEEREMDPEDLKRLLDAMLSEEEDQRAEIQEKLQGETEDTWKDW